MTFAVLNIRPDQTNNLRRVRLLNRNAETALEALHRRVLLCAPRDVDNSGYIGLATLVDLQLDCQDRRYLVAELAGVELFSRPVNLISADGNPHETAATGVAGQFAFHHYGLGLRSLSQSEFDGIIASVSAAASPGTDSFAEKAQVKLNEFNELGRVRRQVLREQAIRDTRLRITVLQHYDPICAVSGTNYGVPKTGRHEIEVCHLRAVKWGGDDAVWNAMPMTRTLHWAYDELLFSMTDSGEFLFSPDMQPPLRERFNGQTRANFPKDPRAWPNADCLAYHRNEFFKG